eukprot:g22932.t1
MVKCILVTVPTETADAVIEGLDKIPDIAQDMAVFDGRRCTQLQFKVHEQKVGFVFTKLGELGVGTNFGTIDVLHVVVSKPRLPKRHRKRKYKVDDRATVEEIFELADSNTHLTFDFLILIAIAGLIASVGLVTDSGVLVVAAMLVSPLMGPIVGLTLGWKLHDREMFWKGMRNELIGMAVTFTVGMLTGLFVWMFWGTEEILTDEMAARGEWYNLVAGVFVAIPSGMGVAVGLTAGSFASLVGVAISASLLPPIVNSGICFTLWLAGGADDAGHEVDYGRISFVSWLLFMINWVCIFTSAGFLFYLKKVRIVKPQHTKLKRSGSDHRRLLLEESASSASIPDYSSASCNDSSGSFSEYSQEKVKTPTIKEIRENKTASNMWGTSYYRLEKPPGND